MSAAALPMQGADALRPQSPGGMGRGALLAIAVHGLLVVALALSVHWRSQTPQTFSAELWAATPQVAAPRAVESTPVAPPPPPPPPPPAPAARVAPPPPAPAVEAKIAIEKAREEKLKIEREQAQREKLERDKLAKAERERLERERERQRDAKAKADAQQREQQAKREQQEQRDKQAAAQAEEQRLAKQREDNLKRMLGQAGATGAPGSTGTALKDAAPSASYAGKLIARIKPNILLTDPVSGNPSADVEVRASPTGSILSRRLVKPSGNKDWDDAVLRAIDRTAELPRDVDGRVPPVLVISFTPSP
jgi:colicin import membrane protein